MSNLKSIRFTSREREALRALAVEAYGTGATIVEVAQQIGCSAATARNLLVESGTKLRPRTGHPSTLPGGMLTSDETAALVGVGRATLNAMQHRGDGPPKAEGRPEGAQRNYTYYWRHEVEQWLHDRAEERLRRTREWAERKSREREIERVSAVHLVLDWGALMKAVDSKRSELGVSWQTVCRSSGADPGHISRIRKGYEPKSGFAAFFQLAVWVCGYVPDEISRFTKQP